MHREAGPGVRDRRTHAATVEAAFAGGDIDLVVALRLLGEPAIGLAMPAANGPGELATQTKHSTTHQLFSCSIQLIERLVWVASTRRLQPLPLAGDVPDVVCDAVQEALPPIACP